MIIIFCMLSFALAEPPVGNSYLEAAQLNHDHTLHPPDLTIPSTRTSDSFNALSNQYLSPGTKGVSQEYGPPDTHQTLSTDHDLPTRGTSVFRSGLTEEYGTPITRSSQYESFHSDLNHSIPSVRNSGVPQKYPFSRNSPSSLYSPPSLRSPPSSQYGTSQFRSSNKYFTHISPVQKYGVPSARTNSQRSQPSNSYSQSSQRLSNGFSTRLQNPQFESLKNPSQSYGTPTRSLSSHYGVTSARNTITKFGGSASSPNSNTNGFASPYPSARSQSLEYGVPSSRGTGLSQGYGAPEGSLTDQGYDYTRNAVEIQNQESANYDFAYKVSDEDTGSDFGHSETRQLGRAEGAYFVLLPDGTKQVVEYEADENGFKPRISVEHIDSATALSAEGPY